MLMQDKNGKDIKTGNLVKIEGGYFKADNGMFRVEHSPGDEGWLGKDYCLIKVKKDGTPSQTKYNLNFWPLSVSVSGWEKKIIAKEHNKQHATIEVVG